VANNPQQKQSRLEANRRKAALTAVKKMEETVTALYAFLRACNECDDGSGDAHRGIADGRTILIGNLKEYSGYLSETYAAEQGR